MDSPFFEIGYGQIGLLVYFDLATLLWNVEEWELGGNGNEIMLILLQQANQGKVENEKRVGRSRIYSEIWKKKLMS